MNRLIFGLPLTVYSYSYSLPLTDDYSRLLPTQNQFSNSLILDHYEKHEQRHLEIHHLDARRHPHGTGHQPGCEQLHYVDYPNGAYPQPLPKGGEQGSCGGHEQAIETIINQP